MKLQDNEWAKCECCGQRTEQIQEAEYGCDYCHRRLSHVLEIVLFGVGGNDNDDTQRLELCSWKCVVAILPTLKPTRFLTLPYVSFDEREMGEGQSPDDLLAILAWNRRTAEWMPIESAPRDGRRLLMTDGAMTQVCYPKLFPRPLSEGGYDPETHEAESRAGDVWEYFRDSENAPGHTWSMVPTHWMPLPEPPKEKL